MNTKTTATAVYRKDYTPYPWTLERAALTFRPASAPSELPSAASVLGALKKRLVAGHATRSASAC